MTNNEIKRPIVTVNPQTANTTGILVTTESGKEAWVLLTEESITIKTSDFDVRVKP